MVPSHITKYFTPLLEYFCFLLRISTAHDFKALCCHKPGCKFCGFKCVRHRDFPFLTQKISKGIRNFELKEIPHKDFPNSIASEVYHSNRENINQGRQNSRPASRMVKLPRNSAVPAWLLVIHVALRFLTGSYLALQELKKG